MQSGPVSAELISAGLQAAEDSFRNPDRLGSRCDRSAEPCGISALIANVLPADAETLLWVGAAALLLCAVIAGFWAGVLCAPYLQELALRRAAKQIQRLAQIVTGELERAVRISRLLDRSASTPLDQTRWQQLDALRSQFNDVWSRLSERQQKSSSAPATRPSETAVGELVWERTPVDPLTSLPDRTAFDQNLKQMLATAAAASQAAGVLLVRVDKAEQLMLRYGPTAATHLQSNMATLVAQSVRDTDLVCRLGADLFAVLLPDVSPLDGARFAETIRAAVRDHRFYLEDDGPAVLLTASFGYAVCLPTDPPSLILDRAGEALDKSQATGRNQLHVHDGVQRVLSRIG